MSSSPPAGARRLRAPFDAPAPGMATVDEQRASDVNREPYWVASNGWEPLSSSTKGPRSLPIRASAVRERIRSVVTKYRSRRDAATWANGPRHKTFQDGEKGAATSPVLTTQSDQGRQRGGTLAWQSSDRFPTSAKADGPGSSVWPKPCDDAGRRLLDLVGSIHNHSVYTLVGDADGVSAPRSRS